MNSSVGTKSSNHQKHRFVVTIPYITPNCTAHLNWFFVSGTDPFFIENWFEDRLCELRWVADVFFDKAYPDDLIPEFTFGYVYVLPIVDTADFETWMTLTSDQSGSKDHLTRLMGPTSAEA